MVSPNIFSMKKINRTIEEFDVNDVTGQIVNEQAKMMISIENSTFQ